jgi:ABC-type branched-subunit amino acid transport system ATPase component
MSDDETPAAELRAWAAGRTDISAATELLIRGGYAQRWRPWVHADDGVGHWIDFASLPELIGAMSGGQQRFLRIAASLGADVPIVLGDEVAGLDREHTRLVLAAVAHANGMHEPGRTVELVEDTPRIVPTSALYTW